MREVLYRGKTKQGEWVYGQYCELKDGKTTIPCIYYKGEIIKETLGQFTGLYGNYGKMIFEGDIVKADDYIFEVKFGKCGGVANAEDYGYMGFYLEGYDEITKQAIKYGLRNDICYFIDIEVIGTVHDNPELLKGGA